MLPRSNVIYFILHIPQQLSGGYRGQAGSGCLTCFQTHPPSKPAANFASSIHPPRCYDKRDPTCTLVSRILTLLSSTTFAITSNHHSNALSTHSLLKLIHSSNNPNHHLEPILIVVDSYSPFYTLLRVHPPLGTSLPQSHSTSISIVLKFPNNVILS